MPLAWACSHCAAIRSLPSSLGRRHRRAPRPARGPPVLHRYPTSLRDNTPQCSTAIPSRAVDGKRQLLYQPRGITVTRLATNGSQDATRLGGPRPSPRDHSRRSWCSSCSWPSHGRFALACQQPRASWDDQISCPPHDVMARRISPAYRSYFLPSSAIPPRRCSTKCSTNISGRSSLR